MKKFFYILVTMLTMVSLNTMADTYIYLHYNYPNKGDNRKEVNYTNRGDNSEEIDYTMFVVRKDWYHEQMNSTIWFNGWFYTDETKTEKVYLADYVFPTYEGYEFEGFGYYGDYEYMGKLMNNRRKDEKAFYERPNVSKELHCVLGEYYDSSFRYHFYGKWKKIEDATGINQIENWPQTRCIYTLGGIRVKEITQSGLYIINGKKTFVKI